MNSSEETPAKRKAVSSEAHSEFPEAGGKKENALPSAKEYAELRARLEELEGMKDRFLRAAADFENAKKRLMRERDEFVKFSQESLIRDLLPILDNFERALMHAGDVQDPALKGIAAGVQMIFKQLGEILKNQGLKRLQSMGEIFDPHCHEAVGYVHEAGKEAEVVEEVEPGYLLHDRLLRAAKVKIRVAPDEQRGQNPSEEKSEEIT